MARWWVCGLLSLLAVAAAAAAAEGNAEPLIRLPTQNEHDATAPAPAPSAEEEEVTRWAVLVAGSSGYENYRHQADVCHAYQILKRGGLKEENIVVFMYDDIAKNPANPRHGVIINHPKGKDGVINQRDADIFFMWKRYEQLNAGSEEKLRALKEIKETVAHRKHLDTSVDFIGKLVFGFEKGPSMLRAPRSSGQPLVDDWDCLKRMVRVFESHCGSLTQYGMKHTRAFANMCNNGVSDTEMKEASAGVCGGYNSARWSPLVLGYSA
uniref:Uncharacterized protein n=1 Tax=Avena sativa TaxID=4498 RepID=A0ACD6AL39_AVESA